MVKHQKYITWPFLLFGPKGQFKNIYISSLLFSILLTYLIVQRIMSQPTAFRHLAHHSQETCGQVDSILALCATTAAAALVRISINRWLSTLPLALDARTRLWPPGGLFDSVHAVGAPQPRSSLLAPHSAQGNLRSAPGYALLVFALMYAYSRLWLHPV
jgi:hypothetical protein